MQRDLIEHVVATSDPALRAVFAEDSAALIGLVIAAAGLAAHHLTGSPAVEVKISMSPLVAGAVLSLSTPDEPTLDEQAPASMAAKYVAAQIMQFGTAARG